MFAYTGGLKGDDGDAGAQGDQGIQGDAGIQGDQGIQGIQGIQGEAGGSGFASQVRAYRSGDQTLVKSTWDLVEFNAEQYDNNSEYDHVTTFRWTCKDAGQYHIDTGIPIDPIAVSKSLLLKIRLNDTIDIFFGVERPGFGGQMCASISGDYEFAADDFIEVYAFHTEVANENTYHAVGDPWLNIHRIN